MYTGIKLVAKYDFVLIYQVGASNLSLFVTRNVSQRHKNRPDFWPKAKKAAFVHYQAIRRRVALIFSHQEASTFLKGKVS